MTLPDQDQASRGAERSYRVTFRGDSYVLQARSRSAARYASWLAFKEAGYRADLPTFAGLIRIEALPPAPPTRNPAEAKKDQP